MLAKVGTRIRVEEGVNKSEEYQKPNQRAQNVTQIKGCKRSAEYPSISEALGGKVKQHTEETCVHKNPSDKAKLAQPSILAPLLDLFPKELGDARFKFSFCTRARIPPFSKIQDRPPTSLTYYHRAKDYCWVSSKPDHKGDRDQNYAQPKKDDPKI